MEPPRPPHIPVRRPKSSAITPTGSLPRASAWPCSRYVEVMGSVGSSAAMGARRGPPPAAGGGEVPADAPAHVLLRRPLLEPADEPHRLEHLAHQVGFGPRRAGSGARDRRVGHIAPWSSPRRIERPVRRG